MEHSLNIIRVEKRYDAKVARLTLWNKNPHCCYCNELTILPADCVPTKDNKANNNMATLEHVYTKFDEERYINDNRFLLTLACFKCNNLMGSIRQAFVPKEELRRRSHLHAEKKEKRILLKLKLSQIASV